MQLERKANAPALLFDCVGALSAFDATHLAARPGL